MGRHARPADQMFRSSFFLLASTLTTAGLSFLFWVVVARFYPPEQVGLATSLISATSLLSYLSMFGLNSTLIRFPAEGRAARNGQITQSTALVLLVSCVAAGIYLLGLPWYGHKLLFVRDHAHLAALFVVSCACASLNLLVKSVFISARMAQYNVLSDGILQGLAKLAAPVALVGFGAAGILGSAGIGYAVAAAAALLLLRRRLGFRFDFRTRGTRLREQLRFSVASYVSSLINLAPVLVTPLIVLQKLGAAEAGYYFVAFQIAALLNSVSTAVGEAVFAEVSSDPSRFGELLRRSAKMIAVVQVPAVAVVAAGSGLLLLVFGGGYTEAASGLLTVLALAALAVALNTWACFGLKLAQRMKQLITANAVLACTTIGLALWWAPQGLVRVGCAWGIGNLAAGLFATAALLRGRPSAPRPPEPDIDPGPGWSPVDTLQLRAVRLPGPTAGAPPSTAPPSTAASSAGASSAATPAERYRP
ncbi:lipopolysaccharide biosynthesis protein [Streptomyces sp. XY533]|uniref:lipopolysaccharide biosynthesis protein n=1 Tax=Streptomyces sp. XY533 TaxID=1519481 RepID=UPI000A5093DD|nr:lipopolysaccharide biosynthesis protein [Streptomyces sp. XY533]